MDTSKMGFFANGLVMAKSEYINKKTGEVRYTIDVGVPGNRINVPVTVDKAVYDKTAEFQPINSKLTLSSFNGATFFTLDN